MDRVPAARGKCAQSPKRVSEKAGGIHSPLFLAIFILRDIHGRNARLVSGLNLGELVR